MNRNQYLAFKKEISGFKKEELIELAIFLKVLAVAFKRFGKVLNIPAVVFGIQQGEMKEVVEFLKKYNGFDKDDVFKLLKAVEQQLGEDYYVEVKAFPTILTQVLEIVNQIASGKVIDGEEMALLGLKVKTADKIYNRDLERDLNKLLGKSL